MLLDTRGIAHGGEGPASSFEWAVSAAASVGVHLVRHGYSRAAAHRHRRAASPARAHDPSGRGQRLRGRAARRARGHRHLVQRHACATPARPCAAAAATACWSRCSAPLDPRRPGCWPGCATARTAAVAVLLDTRSRGASIPVPSRQSAAERTTGRRRCCGRPAGGCCAARPATACPTCGADASRHRGSDLGSHPAARRQVAGRLTHGSHGSAPRCRSCGCRSSPRSPPHVAICLGAVFLTGGWFLPTVFGDRWSSASGCEVARRLSAVPRRGAARRPGRARCYFLLVRYAPRARRCFGIVPSDRLAGPARRPGVARPGRHRPLRRADRRVRRHRAAHRRRGRPGRAAVDTLAVTMRRAALAGLPLLVLLHRADRRRTRRASAGWRSRSAPSASWPCCWPSRASGSAGGAGRCGTPPSAPTTGPTSRPRPLGQVGRRVGATALGLALVVPAVLPDRRRQPFGLRVAAGSARAAAAARRSPSSTRSSTSAENLRRARTTAGHPLPRHADVPATGRPRRVHRRAWRPSELQVSRDDDNVEDGLQPAARARQRRWRRTARTYRVEIVDLDQDVAAAALPVAPGRRSTGPWLYDPSTFNVFGENASTRDLSYTVRGARRAADRRGAAARGGATATRRRCSRFLDLPADVPAEVVRRRSRSSATAPTAYDQALAIQDWLRDPDSSPTPTDVADTVGDANGSQAIAAFLETRQGYCVHFASTMAVMARILDIPARVAVGFTAGTADGQGNRNVGLNDAARLARALLRGRRLGGVRADARRAAPAPRRRGRAAARGPTTPGSTPSSGATASPGTNGARRTAAQPRAHRHPRLRRRPVRRRCGGIGAGPVRVPVSRSSSALGLLLLLPSRR